MRHVERRWPAIDLMKLFTGGHSLKWNDYLTRCDRTGNLDDLMKTLYGIQAGMDDLVKAKMTSEKINQLFLRLQASIENTARRIIKRRIPSPLDHGSGVTLTAKEKLELIGIKRRRDAEFEKFVRKASF